MMIARNVLERADKVIKLSRIELISPSAQSVQNHFFLALRFLAQRTSKYLVNESLNFATFLNHRASA
jgi:hypothetical protein